MPRKNQSAPLSLIESAVDSVYNVAELKTVYTTYLSHFIPKSRFKVKGDFSINKVKKHQLVQVMGEVFADREAFERLSTLMPDGVKTVLKTLVWEPDEWDIREFKNLKPPAIQTVQKTLPGGRKQEVQELNPQYLIFPVNEEIKWWSALGNRRDYYFFLPDALRETVKRYLPAPPEYHLEGIEEIEKPRFLFSDEDRVFAQLEVMDAYIRQGQLKYAKSGDKVLKTSMRQMVEACALQEFYPNVDKDLDFMRGYLMIDFLSAGDNIDLTGAGPKELKTAFNRFFRSADFKTYELMDLLTHLKGRGYIWRPSYSYIPDEEKTARHALAKLLKALPTSRWVSRETLIKHCRCRNYDLAAISRFDAAEYVYFTKPAKYGKDKRYARRSLYFPSVIEPLIKASMFLFASFGLVDIAYDAPRNNRLQRDDKPYLSIHDGLEYVRLTPLGAFVAGKSKSYNTDAARKTAEVTLDDKRLLIHLHGKDPIKEMTLAQLADPVSDRCYKVSFHSFLRGCAAESDIQQRKALFKRHIEPKPAGIWKAFLEDVEGKIDPLAPVEAMDVFRLKENRELISLVARDPELKKHILKAEDHHILIPHAHLSKVKNRLEAFGYLIQDLR